MLAFSLDYYRLAQISSYGHRAVQPGAIKIVNYWKLINIYCSFFPYKLLTFHFVQLPYQRRSIDDLPHYAK